MLSFTPDEEQQMLLQAIEKFTADKMRKTFRDAEEEGHIPDDLLEAGWDFGLIPAAIPETYGGFGEYSVLTGALATEAFAYGDLAITLAFLSPALMAIPIMLSGTEGQKQKYLPKFCNGEMPAYTAATIEPVIQYDPRNLKMTANEQDGGYQLTGVKASVPFAPTADTMLVYANQDGKTQAFLVPLDTDGLQVTSKEKLMGIQGLPCYRVQFNDCMIDKERKLGGEAGIDFDLILNHSRVALAAAAVGVANAGSQYARAYAKERIQFDEPIAHRQSIAFLLAEMAIKVDAARLMVWEAAWKLDEGENATKQATLMKHFVDQMVVEVADSALQILGGYGYIREYPVELWLRNARGFTHFDGLAIV